MKERLVFRHIINEASCQICGAMEETISYSLFHCTHAVLFGVLVLGRLGLRNVIMD